MYIIGLGISDIFVSCKQGTFYSVACFGPF